MILISRGECERMLRHLTRKLSITVHTHGQLLTLLLISSMTMQLLALTLVVRQVTLAQQCVSIIQSIESHLDCFNTH